MFLELDACCRSPFDILWHLHDSIMIFVYFDWSLTRFGDVLLIFGGIDTIPNVCFRFFEWSLMSVGDFC